MAAILVTLIYIVSMSVVEFIIQWEILFFPYWIGYSIGEVLRCIILHFLPIIILIKYIVLICWNMHPVLIGTIFWIIIGLLVGWRVLKYVASQSPPGK